MPNAQGNPPPNWTQCPTCRYELRGLAAESSGRFRCPECGRSWSIAQLHDFALGKFHWGTMPWWLIMPPSVIVLLLVAMQIEHSSSIGPAEVALTIATAIFYWVWWIIIVSRNAKRKFDEFAYVIGCMLGFFPAAITTYLACLLAFTIASGFSFLIAP